MEASAVVATNNWQASRCLVAVDMAGLVDDVVPLRLTIGRMKYLVFLNVRYVAHPFHELEDGDKRISHLSQCLVQVDDWSVHVEIHVVAVQHTSLHSTGAATKYCCSPLGCQCNCPYSTRPVLLILF